MTAWRLGPLGYALVGLLIVLAWPWMRCPQCRAIIRRWSVDRHAAAHLADGLRAKGYGHVADWIWPGLESASR